MPLLLSVDAQNRTQSSACVNSSRVCEAAQHLALQASPRLDDASRCASARLIASIRMFKNFNIRLWSGSRCERTCLCSRLTSVLAGTR
jgi:hypothetical protein